MGKIVKKAKRNKTKIYINTYPSPNKASSKLVSKNNSKLNNRVIQKIKDKKILIQVMLENKIHRVS